MGSVCGSIPQISMSVDVAVTSEIYLSGSSVFQQSAKERKMKPHPSIKTVKTKEFKQSVLKQFFIKIVAAMSFALCIGQGDPSAKTGFSF